MFDDIEVKETPQLAPALPRELASKLFDYSDPISPCVKYSAIGEEGWPKIVALGAPIGFVRWFNPRTTPVRFMLALGPDPQLSAHFEMTLIPREFRASLAFADAKTQNRQAIRREYVRLLVEIGPRETLSLPAVFTQAIRFVDRNGMLSGGHAPFLVIEGEQNPPEMHPSLTAHERTARPVRAGARRRAAATEGGDGD